MRLKDILLINRAPFSKLRLSFESERIALLSGVNGAGKTTIISYIVDAFYELAKQGFHNEFEQIENKFYRISSSLFSLNDSSVSIVYLRFATDDNPFCDYIDIRGECTEGEYDSLIDLPNHISFSEIKRKRKQESVYKYWNINDRTLIRKLFASGVYTYFPAYRFELPSFLGNIYKEKTQFKTDFVLEGYLPNPLEVTSELPQIANWIMDVVLDMYLYHGANDIVFSTINNIISKILSDKVGCETRVGIGQRTKGMARISIMDRNDESHQIYPSIFNMSSGELTLLCLFGEIVKQADTIGIYSVYCPGIVLIDEIEKHLHIKLQKEILPLLIAMFPRIQFIASSHSPFLGLGLEESMLSYSLFDLDHNGIQCAPRDNILFEEVYNIMVNENDRYYDQLTALQKKAEEESIPLIITEGKTDWMHLKAAMKALSIEDMNVRFYEKTEDMGDTVLLQLLENYARIPQSRVIIGVFDRDNLSSLKCAALATQEFVDFGNNVFAFSIPLVNEEDYGEEISIEHYYKREHLTRMDSNGRRIFLGDEFYSTGIGKDEDILTRAKGLDTKTKKCGIIDEKVYQIKDDREGKSSIALSKYGFAELVLSENEFCIDFDFSAFQKIFDIIRKITNKHDDSTDSSLQE